VTKPSKWVRINVLVNLPNAAMWGFSGWFAGSHDSLQWVLGSISSSIDVGYYFRRQM